MYVLSVSYFSRGLQATDPPRRVEVSCVRSCTEGPQPEGCGSGESIVALCRREQV